MTKHSHWTEHARRWQLMRSPLRPNAEDLAWVQRSISRHYAPLAAVEPVRVLLFGVTPELAALTWPMPVELLAFDQSQAMIDTVWPGDTATRRARRGDWFELELSDASVSIALADGCFSALGYPQGYRRMAASLSRVVRSAGLFSVRLFCRPNDPESVVEVCRRARAGEIRNFHAFKWRLAMAMQGDDVATGVNLAAIWRTFHENFGDPRKAALAAGWDATEVQTIDNYRAAEASYSYPTVAEVVAVLSPDFELLEESRGSYALAERCPSLLFRRR